VKSERTKEDTNAFEVKNVLNNIGKQNLKGLSFTAEKGNYLFDWNYGAGKHNHFKCD